MISLKESNKRCLEAHTSKTGIECPKCCNELVDVDPSLVLACYPPKTKFLCPNCGHSGYRFI